jgi:hypothetical protein
MRRILLMLFVSVLCLCLGQMLVAQKKGGGGGRIKPKICDDCEPPDPTPTPTPTPCENPIDDATYFVTQQYHDFLNRDPTGYELATDLPALNSCRPYACYGTERVNMSRRMWDKSEFRQQSFTFGLALFPDSNDSTLQYEHYNDDDFVELEYLLYLRRWSSDPPDDYQRLGYYFWLGALNNCVRNAGSFAAADQCYNDSINAFLLSTEYRARFGCTE